MRYATPKDRPSAVDAASLYQRSRFVSERLKAQFLPNSPPSPTGRTPLTKEEKEAAMALCGPRKEK